jgi:hypothetical protein
MGVNEPQHTAADKQWDRTNSKGSTWGIRRRQQRKARGRQARVAPSRTERVPLIVVDLVGVAALALGDLQHLLGL